MRLIALLIASLFITTAQAQAWGWKSHPATTTTTPPAVPLVTPAPGNFDYYVLSLSWSADWCATTGDARHDPQCASGRDYAFVLHGLWPQNEQGYPDNCHTSQRDPSRSQSAAMTDITGSAGLAWHEWQKHGRCTGLSAQAFYDTARKAYTSIAIPPELRHLNKQIDVAPSVIVDAFIAANPGLKRTMIAVTCDKGKIQEARICLTKTLQPRPCSPEAARSCHLSGAEMDPVR
ncbi:ribonuclease I [mine drainage metagenome]|uniref:Ribonuclease I n=1 Tax=mine drainage metagenome TaxID=410659 RepID=A0A1J5PVL1_9ZZZZ